MNDNSNPLNKSIPERYIILGELGSGGMGAVYKVKDKTLDKIFALKILTLQGPSDGSEIIRFQKEAKAVAALRHRKIMEIIDFGIHEKTTPYMVLEFIEGLTLKQYLKKHGALETDAAVSIFIQIAEALQHAHSNNIIHRDLKSDNILVSTDTGNQVVIKLFDFGIARITESLDSLKLTTTNAIIGTPSVMSPEQVRGEKVDARSDIYSFGCVMFQSLTGRMPFSAADTFALLELHKDAEAPKVGSLRKELSGTLIETIIERCLKKDRSERFQSAKDLLDALLEVDDQSSLTEELKPVAPSVNNMFRNWKVILLVAVSFILLFVSALTLLQTSEKESEKNPDEPKRKHTERPAGWWKAALHDENESTQLDLTKIKNFEDDDLLLLPRNHSISLIDVSEPAYSGAGTGSMFSSSKLSDAGFENLSKMQNVKGVIVRNNLRISVNAIRSLAKLKQLQFLDTSVSGFEDPKSLAQLTHLTSILLYKTTPETIRVLKNIPIEKLVLEDVSLDVPIVNAICELKGLKTLCLDSSAAIDAQALNQLGKLPLHDLSIANSTAVNDEVIDAICTLTQIDTLVLKDDSITDNHVLRVATMDNLRTLHLETNSRLTDASLKHLAKSSKLQSLIVHNCPGLTDNGIAVFKKETRSRCRIDAENSSGTEGDHIPKVSPLSDSVSYSYKDLPQTRNIDWHIEMGDAPTVHLATIRGFVPSDLANLPAVVREIDVTGLELTDNLFRRIANCKNVTDIKMHGLDNVKSSHVAALKSLPHLRFITANGSSFQNAKDLSQLKGLKKLTVSGLTPEQISAFKDLPRLTELSLEGIMLSKQMLTALSGLSGLTKMELRNISGIEPGALSAIGSLKNLKELTINGASGMTRTDLLALTKLKLEKLQLRRDALTDEDLKNLAQMSSLTHLDISENEGFRNESLAYFVSTPKLKWLRIVECGFDRASKDNLVERRRNKGKFELIKIDKKQPYYQ